IRDSGIGGFNLVDRGYHVQNTEHHAQISETAVLGTSAVNETRFQYFRVDGSIIANNFSPAIQVLGSFNAGGAQVGHYFDARNNYELQNYTSIARGPHAWRFGVRLRGETIDSSSPQNFGGTFTFGGGVGISSLERYRRTLLFAAQGLSPEDIRASGGGAAQFSVNAGNPAAAASQADVGAFVGDDWRARPNLTLSFGLRYETQTNIHDWHDFAPRIRLAWAPRARAQNPRPQTLLPARFGLFYERFRPAKTPPPPRDNG